MSDRKKMFPEEVELSEIVLDRTNQAFEKIRQEDDGNMKKTTISGRRLFKTQAAAIAGVCILGISGISAAAAIHHYWGRGMNGNIQATDTQQQELTEKGVAKVYGENPDYSSLAVSDKGITIAPGTVVVDDRYAYLSFRISGYNLEEGTEPGFETVGVYQGDNQEDEDSWVNMSGSMYDGIVMGENGTAVYDDGSALKKQEDGSIVSRYTDEDGNMEYIIQASVADENDSLTGKTIHVNFKNLGTVSQSGFSGVTDGEWDFAIRLSDVSSSREMSVGKEVGESGFEINNIDISPISIKVNYSVAEAPDEQEDENGIPQVKGVVLEDGTRIPYLTDGGMTGYTDNNRTKAYQVAGFERVIDTDEVAALLVAPSEGGENIEIPVSK